MKQKRTNINNFSEHALNDHWNAESEVLLSEEWIGTTRFRLLSIKLQEGYKMVTRRPITVQHGTRPDTIWPEEWPRLSQK